jgi:trimethylamine monooxygenase
MKTKLESIAIIGLGVSGISQLRSFKKLGKQGIKIPKIIAYEKQDTFGGLWNKTWRTGVDSNGEMVHSSIYNHLWSNGPKECLEFPDYSFDKHFGFPIPSYPPFSVLRSYLDGYYRDSDVADWALFNTVVRKVDYSELEQKFIVNYQNLESGKTSTDLHDYIVVAAGHFSTPNVPSFLGLETFTGRILHAHDFREASEFKGKNVTIIGSSYSAEDIGSQCLKYGANSITLSYRTKPTNLEFGSKWSEHELLIRVEGNKLFFLDGHSCESDAIIMCTGYKHHFPFLSDNLRLSTTNKLWVNNLYKGIAWEENPKLLYLGMQDQYFTYNMFAAQAWYARDLIMGKISLPEKSERIKDEKIWEEEYNNLPGTHEANIYFQGKYVKHLVDQTDYPKFDIDGMCKTFMDWENYKHNHAMSYRDLNHTSLITGTKAPKPNITWFENYQDNLGEYLEEYKILGDISTSIE